MTDLPSTAITANTRVSLVREKSNAALIQAIHSPNDEEYTLNRTRTCLKLYFDPEMNAADRAEMIDSYAKALRSYPKWAVAQAFDQWERDKTHRPSPAALVALAGRAVKRMTDELARRESADEAEREPKTEDQKIEASAIAERAGFTAKLAETLKARPMVNTFKEADEVVNKPLCPHWAEGEAQDSPKMEALRKARQNNELIRQARASREET